MKVLDLRGCGRRGCHCYRIERQRDDLASSLREVIAATDANLPLEVAFRAREVLERTVAEERTPQ